MNQQQFSATSTANVKEASSSARATGFTLAATESRSLLAAGEQASARVLSNQGAAQGGYRVEVQLASGQQLSLMTNKPFSTGQELHLTGKTENQLEVRANVSQLQQQLANQLSQQPSIRLQLFNPSLPSIPSGTATLATVTASQPLTNNQGHLVTLQLADNRSVQVISSQPLAKDGQFYLARDTQGELSIREVPAASRSLAQGLVNNLPVLPASISNAYLAANAATQRPEALGKSLSSLLASASEQLRYALPRQAPMHQSLSQLNQLLLQLMRATTTANPVNPAPTTAEATSNSRLAAFTSQVEKLSANLSDKISSKLAAKLGARFASSAPKAADSASTSSATPANPAARLVSLMQQFLSSFPQGSGTPTAAGLQNFLAASGMFLESRLLAGASVNGDIKLQLHKLAHLVRQEMSSNQNQNLARQEVLQQIDKQLQTMKSRLTVQQLSSLQATQATAERGQPAQVIQLDVPYMIRGDWFETRLEIRRWLEEKETEEEVEEFLRKTKIWEVRFAFTLPDYGKIHTHLRLQDVNLKADIWIAEEDSFRPVQREAEVLVARLRRLGAEIDQVNCYAGDPNAADISSSRRKNRQHSTSLMINTKI